MFHIKIRSKLDGYNVVDVEGAIRAEDYVGQTVYCLVQEENCTNLGVQYGVHYLCMSVTRKDPTVFSTYKIDGKYAIYTLDTIEKGSTIINFIDQKVDFEI